MKESLLDLVGGTPLVRLRSADGGAPVYAKLEYLNPGGSVKDRAALAMVCDAERRGLLAPGGTIVEGTSGNTGTGLAQVAAARGYGMVVVLPHTTAVEKLDVLRAYGAEVVLATAGLPADHPDHVVNTAARLATELPGGWWADQYGNPANPRVHTETTGPEIWADTGGRVTHFVASIGTGGTISGTGAYLKAAAEGAGRPLTVVGADPVTSAYGGGDGSPYMIEASGHFVHPAVVCDQWPASYHTGVVDRVETATDRESVHATRRLARTEGLLVGGSSGLVAEVATRVAWSLGPDDLVVALLPDSGRAYLSKYHSDTWCRRTGFLDDDRPGLLADHVDPATPVHTIVPMTTRGEAAALFDGAARHQPALPVGLPGRSARFALAGSEILGLVTREDLDGDPDAPVPVSGPPPLVGTGETPAEARARVGAVIAVVLRDGRLVALTHL